MGLFKKDPPPPPASNEHHHNFNETGTGVGPPPKYQAYRILTCDGPLDCGKQVTEDIL